MVRGRVVRLEVRVSSVMKLLFCRVKNKVVKKLGAIIGLGTI